MVRLLDIVFHNMVKYQYLFYLNHDQCQFVSISSCANLAFESKGPFGLVSVKKILVVE